jgi:hypothetical protein
VVGAVATSASLLQEKTIMDTAKTPIIFLTNSIGFWF